MVIISQCVNKHLSDLQEVFDMLSREYGVWGYARVTGKFKVEKVLGKCMNLDMEEPSICSQSGFGLQAYNSLVLQLCQILLPHLENGTQVNK